MIRRPPRSTPLYSSAASDVYKRQAYTLYMFTLLFTLASLRNNKHPCYHNGKALRQTAGASTRDKFIQQLLHIQLLIHEAELVCGLIPELGHTCGYFYKNCSYH
eukprot:TRINITY_DN13602_c0_g3_i15.p4 TRINITY_DN13602_c0_g3~~TRINITY_DN13602_c0_g3_i15.p4  ORF type:complete len:111 (+),score=8.67 TRINITY_DN13602_c0_g3_i15:23-334(+)